MSEAQVRIEPMTANDLDGVVQIVEPTFEPRWTHAGLASSLAQEHVHCRVLRCDGELVAYAIWSCVLDEQELQMIATAPAARRRGFARRLLEAMLDEGRALGATTCFLDVRASNAPAIALYRAFGFEELERRARYYGDEDAIVMQRRG